MSLKGVEYQWITDHHSFGNVRPSEGDTFDTNDSITFTLSTTLNKAV